MRLLLSSVLALSIAMPAYAQLAPPNAAGITYGHVHLNVRDIEVHKKLWVEHFGGVVVQKGPLVAVKLPGVLIAFRQAEPTGGSEGTVMDHFDFKVRTLAEVLQVWRAAGSPQPGALAGGSAREVSARPRLAHRLRVDRRLDEREPDSMIVGLK
jgi:hypothetical protein